MFSQAILFQGLLCSAMSRQWSPSTHCRGGAKQLLSSWENPQARVKISKPVLDGQGKMIQILLRPELPVATPQLPTITVRNWAAAVHCSQCTSKVCI